MSMGNRLVDDYNHFRECHERWGKRLNRDMAAPEYQDEWYQQQCLFCRYFIPLSGAFRDDYGACSNTQSPCDGRVMFEHDGCEQFQPNEDECITSSSYTET
jgi:hypothetical protein